MMASKQWERARRILCVRLDSMGDVLMCTPAMRALKQGYSQGQAQHDGDGARQGRGVDDRHATRSLTLLSSPSGAAAAAYIPELDGAIAYAAPWVKAGPGQFDHTHLGVVETLRAQSFDAAVIFNSYSQSALPAAMLCFLAGIPLRLAYSRENPYALLSDRIPDPEPELLIKHEVRRQLDLVKEVGCPPTDTGLSFTVQDQDLAAVRRLLSAHGIEPGHPWILLHPGANAPSRRYSPEQWIALLRLLAASPGHPLVLTGGPDETDLVTTICQASGTTAISLAGRLSLGQLAASIALARVVVSNNTGPAHLAAALGTPVVDLYALTNPQHTPWNVPHRTLFHDVPCRFCYKSECPEGHHDCLSKLAPSRVASAVLSLMGKAHWPYFLLKSS